MFSGRMLHLNWSPRFLDRQLFILKSRELIRTARGQRRVVVFLVCFWSPRLLSLQLAGWLCPSRFTCVCKRFRVHQEFIQVAAQQCIRTHSPRVNFCIWKIRYFPREKYQTVFATRLQLQVRNALYSQRNTRTSHFHYEG